MDQAIATAASAGPAAAERADSPSTLRPPGVLTAAAALWQREMARFFRQRNRVVGALGTPIVFWLLLGSGLDRTFVVTNGPASPDADAGGYLAYLFPGALVMILLFTAIFSTITVIEDRREGFLQGVLAAPVSRLAIVLGKVLGAATIATLQGIVFLAIWPLVGDFPGWGDFAAAVAAIFVVAVGLAALGLCFAWPMESTTGFHAVMNLLLMPMWFLSGAMFPAATAPPWLAAIMVINPLTYGHALIASLLHGGGAPLGPTIVTLATAAVTIALAVRIAQRPQTR